MEDLIPTSEVGSPPQDQSPGGSVVEPPSLSSAGMEAIFMKIAEKLTACRPVQNTATKFVNFDPDEPESDVENWCTLTEMIIEKKKLEGVDLILALTHSLKGRAATCLTKIPPEQLSWKTIKEVLISRFSKPMTIQDHFDQIIKFQIETKDNPGEAGMRLWQLIEKIPGANLPEKVITGFAISVLSQCDEKIRRELNSVVINDKHQLFRTLRGFTLKRKNEEPATSDPDMKRFQGTIPFRGTCNFCGRTGHRGIECRDKQRLYLKSTNPARTDQLRQPAQNSRPQATCYVCNDPGHVASACPMRYKKQNFAPTATPGSSKQVNICSRTSHGT
ncbi:uncharacterized protein LOC115440330 [Manduca sexta]|uniref:uncharacterized protein LOC115440330 n=1 Tax=Manduca sexta TaxID=7130 RepID=UPI0011845C68|nr:uncharacterized protein LOC115440330 [Manduca sexta]